MSQYVDGAQSNPKSPERSKLFTRWGQLKVERATWWAHWQEISQFLLPRSGRFFVQNRNKGWRMHNSIYDRTGTGALRILGAGMMAGASSPARKWFRVVASDPELNKAEGAKQWLFDATDVVLEILQKNNSYRVLHGIYEELAAFGTAATVILPDYKSVTYMYPMTVGEFAIATNFKGEVCTLYREFERPVAEVVKRFGLENCSDTVQHMYKAGSLDQWIRLIHCIEPREDRDVTKKDNKNMPWKSIYFEVGGNPNKYLEESGYEYFPVLAPRWAVQGGDIYGNCPGMESLGDIKQLQHMQLRKSQVIDYKVNPPLQVPTGMSNREVETLPGGITYYDTMSPQGGIKTLFDVNLDLQPMLFDIQDCRDRINKAFYADLFLMLANSNVQGMTATEVAERHEEKLLMLGPVSERLNNELLAPLIETTFNIALRSGVLPPLPPELNGQEINIEFVSMLAQAQKAVGINSVDRFVSSLGLVAQIKPDVLDKFEGDKWVDIASDMLGVDPSLIAADKNVMLIRQQRAQAQQQAQQNALLEQQAGAVKNLAQAPTGQDNALTNVMDMFQGYNTNQG